MATTTIEVETAARNPRHARLESWVEEVAQMCKKDRFHWCYGSPEEYKAMLSARDPYGHGDPAESREASQQRTGPLRSRGCSPCRG